MACAAPDRQAPAGSRLLAWPRDIEAGRLELGATALGVGDLESVGCLVPDLICSYGGGGRHGGIGRARAVAEGRVLPGGRGGAGVGGLVSAFVILASIRCARGYKSLNFIYAKNVYRLAIVFAVNCDCPCPFFGRLGCCSLITLWIMGVLCLRWDSDLTRACLRSLRTPEL